MSAGTSLSGLGPDMNLRHRTALAKSLWWNLAGYLLPLVAAVFCARPLINGLGDERFGVLALAWVVVGYFSVFDLGLGRALTQLVSHRMAGGEEITSITWTSLAAMSLLGVIGGIGVFAASPFLVGHVFKFSTALRPEATNVFHLLAISIPIVVLTTGLRGLLEALQRFDYVNFVRFPLGLSTYLGPVLILPFTHNMVAIVGVIVVTRVIALVAHAALCWRAAGRLVSGLVIDLGGLNQLVQFGGWMTVTNIVGPALIYIDRFAVGAISGVSAVTFYAIPFELINRLLSVSYAISGVLFPAFTVRFRHEPKHASLLYRQGLTYTLIVVLPVSIAAIIFAHDALAAWLGADLADHSATVLRWLSVGLVANSLGSIAFAFVQGIGRPDLSAKLHLMELPIYVFVLVVLVSAYGVAGAAFAWMLRTALDASALCFLAARLAPTGVRTAVRAAAIAVVADGLAWFVADQTLITVRIGAGLCLMLLSVMSTLIWCLPSKERVDPRSMVLRTSTPLRERLT